MLFRKKSKPDIQITLPPTSRVEVEVAKTANKKAVKKAKAVGDHVNDLLVENGISFKLYLALGGQLEQKKGRASS